MTRQFEKPDYEARLHKTIQVGEALPEEHLARFVVKVISLLDLESIYRQYAHVGGKAIAPEVLLGLLVYGYASGVFSSWLTLAMKSCLARTSWISRRRERMANTPDARANPPKTARTVQGAPRPP